VTRQSDTFQKHNISNQCSAATLRQRGIVPFLFVTNVIKTERGSGCTMWMPLAENGENRKRWKWSARKYPQHAKQHLLTASGGCRPPQARAVVWYHMRRGKIVSVFDPNVLKCVVPETARWVFGSGSKNRLTPHPPDVRFHEEVVIFPLIQPAVPVSASVSRIGGPLSASCQPWRGIIPASLSYLLAPHLGSAAQLTPRFSSDAPKAVSVRRMPFHWCKEISPRFLSYAQFWDSSSEPLSGFQSSDAICIAYYQDQLFDRFDLQYPQYSRQELTRT